MRAARNHARISPAAPRPASHETFIDLRVGNVRNSPVGFHGESGTDHLGFFGKQLVPFCLDAQPNGVRLSCATELEYSQMKDYLRNRGGVSSSR